MEFTNQMKKTHTILAPMMLPIHFRMICGIIEQEGYKVELLETKNQEIINEGLKNVHNDTCYPALLVIGQLIDALKSGKYDVERTACLISQTGGGCRASNYLSLLRKALIHAGFDKVPVISLNFAGLEKNSGFSLSIKCLIKASFAIMYGDMLMWISNQCKPYEANTGESQKIVDNWTNALLEQFKTKKFLNVKYNYKHILDDFTSIKLHKRQRLAVGIVGEIYMKYAALGNNSLEDLLISQGAEPVLSGLMDFCLYCTQNAIVDSNLYGNRSKKNLLANIIAQKYLLKRQKQMINAIRENGVFTPPTEFLKLIEFVDGYIDTGVKMGEGWLLTAEMLELIHSGINNIVCTQPFGCLPNHVVAKGMIRKIKESYPQANIVAIDYDPGATKINQENRIKLMLANAYSSLHSEEAIDDVTFSEKIIDTAKNLYKKTIEHIT